MTQPEPARITETDTVYLTVRHKKKTIMFFCKETDTVHRVKLTLLPLVKATPENQRLYYGSYGSNYGHMEDGMLLSQCGITSLNAKAQQPAELALVLREDSGQFEAVDIVPYSTPPPLPDVMQAKEPQA
ncbi:elongin-B-like [Paramacrobiotus metropolitanus]|uniref:elongin-B-like n=1 Tax=Paramacrobiotus metropolitanus TaxID=2943436 RepID=UPI0024458E89|nr:elongin-B-like [Paramacrobiotus metropolitanus]XP_055335212.1 elongin-B-like [Paramacrobiotus metropolitanus]